MPTEKITLEKLEIDSIPPEVENTEFLSNVSEEIKYVSESGSNPTNPTQ
ncbi:MAG: hypothetical protein PF588_09700 [Candidatus Kapabacteria bacterium]|jgi:hypothetical protein|nr:hypothetical protein [Candidatus Kapabacteria bacterium]